VERARNRPLKVGVFFPHGERDMGGSTPKWTDILGMARYAEELGFDSFWLPDHLLFRFADQEDQGIAECWTLLAGLAASTSVIKIGPFVTCMAWRNPALLAKMAATVDEISGGRLILGLGAGWHEPEFRAFGFPFDHRVDRFSEAIRILSGLLRDGWVDFEGTYFSARNCELRPRGSRHQGPPIMIGSVGERMLNLVASYADSWNAFFWWIDNRPDGIPPVRERVDAACKAVGRNPASLERTACVLVEFPGRTGTQFAERPQSGDAVELANTLRAFAREGISHVQIRLDPNTLAGVNAMGDVLAILDQG
jgi:probable F420-dependent oxidoreductase